MCSEIRVFACLDTLLDLIQGAGWDGDNENLRSRRLYYQALREHLVQGRVRLYLPPSLITAIYFSLTDLCDAHDALIQLNWIVKSSHCNVTVDYDVLWERSILLVQDFIELEVHDVLCLLSAHEMGVDYFIAHKPSCFQPVLDFCLQDNAELNIRIVEIDALLSFLPV
jgi:hypothetical protein